MFFDGRCRRGLRAQRLRHVSEVTLAVKAGKPVILVEASQAEQAFFLSSGSGWWPRRLSGGGHCLHHETHIWASPACSAGRRHRL